MKAAVNVIDSWVVSRMDVGFCTRISIHWVAVKELNLMYHDPETMLYIIYPSYGNLN